MNSEKLFKHMSWSNQQIVGKLAQLPDEALNAYAVNPEWTVREIARHICSSATWYGWRLLDRTKLSQSELDALKVKLDATEIPPATAHDIPVLLEKMLEADAVLLAASREPEGTIERVVDGKTIIRARSTVLSQSIHHATEHRAQLVSALEAKGFTSINLDDYDLWAYCDAFGE